MKLFSRLSRSWSKGFVHKLIFRCLSTNTLEKIVKSPAPLLDLPKGNFVKHLFKNVEKWSTRTALECSSTGRKLSYSELLSQSAKWSGYLKHIGISIGQTVAFVSPNCVQFGPIFLGSAAVGVTFSGLSFQSTSDEIKVMLELNDATVLVYGSAVKELVFEAVKGREKKILLLCIGKSDQTDVPNVEDILHDTKRIAPLQPEELTGEEIVHIFFSSGTTGFPKAIAQSHNAFIANMYQFTNSYHGIARETTDVFQDVTIADYPLNFVGSLMISFSYSIFMGSKIVLLPIFSYQAFLDTIIRHKVRKIFAVPSALNLLNHNPGCNPETMKHLDVLISGAAPVSVSVVKFFKEKIKKDITYHQAYGMTETLVTIMTQKHSNIHGSCGQLLSNVEGKLIDTETGDCLGPNSLGEICIKTPSVMQGYLKNSKATEEILRNGWIHSGDIGYYDNDGNFYVTDRIKDLINVDGYEVSPTELEEVLQNHPAVQECCVVGISDDILGEIPKAYVVPNREIKEEELHNFLEKKLTHHKHLKGGITFVQSLPKSEVGKFLRKTLRKKWE